MASPTDPRGENPIATGQFLCDSSHTSEALLANGFQCGNGQRSLPLRIDQTEGVNAEPSIVR